VCNEFEELLELHMSLKDTHFDTHGLICNWALPCVSMPLHDTYLQVNNYLVGVNTCAIETLIHPHICCWFHGLCKP
jgi:hypothetical protein